MRVVGGVEDSGLGSVTGFGSTNLTKVLWVEEKNEQ